MISVDGLTVEFGDRALFKDISFQINEKDRIALMGKNGAGKSTLLKILAGQRKPSRGNVSAPKDTVIAYLPQHLMTEDGRTVYEEASQAFAPLFAMEKRIDDLNRQLTERTDYDSPEYYKLIEEVSALSEKYYSIDLTHFEADVEKTLLGLGFKREDLQRQTSDFSGGWRTGQNVTQKSGCPAFRRTHQSSGYRLDPMAGRISDQQRKSCRRYFSRPYIRR